MMWGFPIAIKTLMMMCKITKYISREYDQAWEFCFILLLSRQDKTMLDEGICWQGFCENVRHLLIRRRGLYAYVIALDMFAEVVKRLIDMFGARPQFWQTG